MSPRNGPNGDPGEDVRPYANGRRHATLDMMAITPPALSLLSERLPSLRADLERSRAWLRHEIEERQRYLALPSAASDEGIGHDSAEDLYERDLRLVELASYERDLRDVDAALGRMRCGIYGTCLDCGRPIPLDRLGARPQAGRDIECERAAQLKAAR